MFVLGLSIAHTAAALGTLLHACLCVRQSQLLVPTAGEASSNKMCGPRSSSQSHNPICCVPNSGGCHHAICEALAVQQLPIRPPRLLNKLSVSPQDTQTSVRVMCVGPRKKTLFYIRRIRHLSKAKPGRAAQRAHMPILCRSFSSDCSATQHAHVTKRERERLKLFVAPHTSHGQTPGCPGGTR